MFFFYNIKIYLFDWLIFIFFFLFLLVLAFFLVFINFLIGNKIYNYEKITPFECGFEPFADTRHSFNLHFYIVALIFLLFDVELIFLVPFTFYNMYISWVSFFVFNFFLFCLLFGIIYELSLGILSL